MQVTGGRGIRGSCRRCFQWRLGHNQYEAGAGEDGMSLQGREGGGCIKVRIRCQRAAAAAAAGEVKKMHLSVAQPLQGAGKKLLKIMAS